MGRTYEKLNEKNLCTNAAVHFLKAIRFDRQSFSVDVTTNFIRRQSVQNVVHEQQKNNMDSIQFNLEMKYLYLELFFHKFTYL